MDTLTAFRESQGAATVSDFMISGASKRGWTTWLTAAVDKRVMAFIPIVMDDCNFVKNVHHHFEAYGGWSFALQDYYELNFTLLLDDPQVAEMMTIIDPAVYFDRFAGIPKLVIDAAGDEFFLPDDEYYWWADLPEPKYFLEVPNAEHSMITGIVEVLAAVVAFANNILDDSTPLPQFSWTIDWEKTGNITLTVPAGQPRPTNVTMWAADTIASSGRRDFRLIAGWPKPNFQPVIWESFPLDETSPGSNTWIAVVPTPAVGWTGVFIDVKFDGPESVQLGKVHLDFTTTTSIVPNTFPFPPCSGSDCYGTLV
jgi:PhoPQ-activated pathogenicity-related protein